MTIPEGIEAPTVIVQPIATQQIAFQPITTLPHLSNEQECHLSNVLVTQPLNIGNQFMTTPSDKDCQPLNLQPGQMISMISDFQGQPIMQDMNMQNFQAQSLPIGNLQGIKEGQMINIVQPLTPGQINLQPVQGAPLNLQQITGGQIVQSLTPGQIIQPIANGQNFVTVQPVAMYRQTVVSILKEITGKFFSGKYFFFLRYLNLRRKKKNPGIVLLLLIFMILSKNCQKFTLAELVRRFFFNPSLSLS